MAGLLNRELEGISTLRLRFEIRPVDMNACGTGLTNLKPSGVANVSGVATLLDPVPDGRIVPIGSDLEKLGIILDGSGF